MLVGDLLEYSYECGKNFSIGMNFKGRCSVGQFSIKLKCFGVKVFFSTFSFKMDRLNAGKKKKMLSFLVFNLPFYVFI